MTATESTTTLRERRQAIVDEHLGAENAGDLERTLATFHDRPRYVMLGQELDGHDAVSAGLTALLSAFPDFCYHVTETHHADAAVILYGHFTAHHRGAYSGIEATDRTVDVPGVAIFHFDEDRLLDETVVFDNDQLVRQIGGRE